MRMLHQLIRNRKLTSADNARERRPKTSTRPLGAALNGAIVVVATVVPLILISLFSVRAEQAPRPTEQELQQTKTWIYSLALQAATYGTPIVAMYNLRDSNAVGPNAKVHPGQIWRMDNVSTPQLAAESGYVTPNVNTLYGFGFLDLNQQPTILTVPDSHGRYYMVEIVDMWSNAFAYVGGVATGYNGGNFALVGPGWQGTLPAGVKRIDCPTRWVLVQPRVHIKDEKDLPGAKQVLSEITVQGLAQYQGEPAPATPSYNYPVPRVNPKVASSLMQFDDPVQFWEIFSAAMNENPPPEGQIKWVLPQLKYLGLVLGQQWKPSSVNPLILEQMKLAAEKIGLMMNQVSPVLVRTANGWVIPPPNTGDAGADYVCRGVVAVIGLTGNVVAEAIYFQGLFDAKAQPLTGEKRYTLTFKEPMKFIPPGFWSLTVYDGVTHYTVPNPIKRYTIGSDNDLKTNPDNSFTIYLQKDSPGADKESNWLPTPAGPFYLYIRIYAPGSEVVESLSNPSAYPPPPAVVPVQP
jgi:hypothetical protein